MKNQNRDRRNLPRFDGHTEKGSCLAINQFSPSFPKTIFFQGHPGRPVEGPPGYPFFYATVLEIWDGFVDDLHVFRNQEELNKAQIRAFRAIYVAQSLLLGFSTILLFLWMEMHLRLRHAFLLALLFGSSPYTIILTGLLHYSILHMFMLIASGYALSLAMKSQPLSMRKMTGAGLLWGLTTLVRPITLILPVFVLIMLFLRFRPSMQPVLKGGGSGLSLA